MKKQLIRKGQKRSLSVNILSPGITTVDEIDENGIKKLKTDLEEDMDVDIPEPTIPIFPTAKNSDWERPVYSECQAFSVAWLLRIMYFKYGDYEYVTRKEINSCIHPGMRITINQDTKQKFGINWVWNCVIALTEQDEPLIDWWWWDTKRHQDQHQVHMHQLQHQSQTIQQQIIHLQQQLQQTVGNEAVNQINQLIDQQQLQLQQLQHQMQHPDLPRRRLEETEPVPDSIQLTDIGRKVAHSLGNSKKPLASKVPEKDRSRKSDLKDEQLASGQILYYNQQSQENQYQGESPLQLVDKMRSFMEELIRLREENAMLRSKLERYEQVQVSSVVHTVQSNLSQLLAASHVHQHHSEHDAINHNNAVVSVASGVDSTTSL